MAVAVGAAAVMVGVGAPVAVAQICLNTCPGQRHPRYITATAAEVHGPDGLIAAGWRCQHVQGRLWSCTWRPRHF